MAKEKVTITLDRSKAEAARILVNASSTSAVIDTALEHLINTQRLRRDIAAYRASPPPGDVEAQISRLADNAALDDDVDWEALYADQEEA
jgi:hypothetical protein